MKSLSFDSQINYYVTPVMQQSVLGSVICGRVTSYVRAEFCCIYT